MGAPTPTTEDRALARAPDINTSSTFIQLKESDQQPIQKGWGLCLAGIFAGRFPGKEAVLTLMKRWPSPAHVTFHSRGWMFFQFPTHYGLKTTLEDGPYAIFGIPLFLEQVEDNFSFKKQLQAKIPVWIRIPDLPPTLWTKSAIEKIASAVGDPLSVDERTIKKEMLDGPRVQVMIDASIPARSSIELRTFSGEKFTQEIKFEFQPRFCSTCKIYGHYGRDCPGPRTRGWQNQRPNHTTERRYPPQGAGPSNNGTARHHSRPRTGGKNNEVANQPQNKETAGQGAKPLQWKETGGTVSYPAHIKTLRNKNGVLVHSSRSEEASIPTSPNRFASLAGEGSGDNGNEVVPRTNENEVRPGPSPTDHGKEILQEKGDEDESSATADSESTEWVLASEVKLNKNWEEEVTGPAAENEEEDEWETHEIATIPPHENMMGNPNLASSSFSANGSLFVSDRNKATEQCPGMGNTINDQPQEKPPEGNDKGKGISQDNVEEIAERALQKINTAKGKGQQNGKKKPPSYNTPSKRKKGHSATKRGFR